MSINEQFTFAAGGCLFSMVAGADKQKHLTRNTDPPFVEV
jgi:hypothetical protein